MQLPQGSQGQSLRFFEKVFQFFCSLRLAVIVILGLTAALIAATVTESLYDTPTAQYYVYRSFWFYLVLALLGINIFAVMVSRFPWKRHHAPFLFAHIGILFLLFGAWVTMQYGLDASMRLVEGESTGTVEINDPRLVVADGDQIQVLPIAWQPPSAPFLPKKIAQFGLTVDRYLSHAAAEYQFVPLENSDSSTNKTKSSAAVQIRIQGGPMRIEQNFWLWLGDPSFQEVQAGPAKLVFNEEQGDKQDSGSQGSKGLLDYPGPYLKLVQKTNGTLLVEARGARSGAQSLGNPSKTISPSRFILDEDALSSLELKPYGLDLESAGWKKGVTVSILKWIPKAAPWTHYVASPIQQGSQAPPSAIHVISGNGGEGAELWLGLGDRATLTFQGRPVSVSYQTHRLQLPFQIHLERFNIEYYTGNKSPKSYSSQVSVEGGAHLVSMNEPLTWKGITFYQSSYEDASPRPTVSIFSVNRDPGRWMKYLGSLLLVGGIVLLFAARLKKARTSKILYGNGERSA